MIQWNLKVVAGSKIRKSLLVAKRKPSKRLHLRSLLNRNVNQSNSICFSPLCKRAKSKQSGNVSWYVQSTLRLEGEPVAWNHLGNKTALGLDSRLRWSFVGFCCLSLTANANLFPIRVHCDGKFSLHVGGVKIVSTWSIESCFTHEWLRQSMKTLITLFMAVTDGMKSSSFHVNYFSFGASHFRLLPAAHLCMQLCVVPMTHRQLAGNLSRSLRRMIKRVHFSR